MAQDETNVQAPTKKSSKGLTINAILGEIAEFKGWEIIFRAILYAFLCWAVHSLYMVYQFHHDPAYAHVQKYSVHDLKVSIIPTLFFFLYKRICLALFYPYMKRTLHPTKFLTEEDRVFRATKNSVWLSGIIYYTFTTCLSYYLFKDSWFFPNMLGGSNQCADIYKYTPMFPEVPYAKFFYQMQFGWHFHTLIDHVVYKWREPKFWEMFLHHCVAVFLIFFSYISNQLGVGILVLTTHDPCDIGLYGTRLFNDRSYKTSLGLGIIYIYFMASWMYCRLFVFPKCIVGAGIVRFGTVDPSDIMYNVYLFMIVMLAALVLLHLYWFIFIVKIVIAILCDVSDPNVYDKSAHTMAADKVEKSQ